MRFQPGRSGNPAGRPPRAPELRAALRANAAVIARLLPNIQMTAHDLLRTIYTNENVPLPIRLQAATACLPVENSGLSAAELLDDMRRKELAARAAQARGVARRPGNRTTAPPPAPAQSTPDTLRAEDYI